MRRFLRNNGLSLALLGLFAMTMVGQMMAGWRDYNNDREDRGQPKVGLVQYLGSGHFWEATAENWESEFLQMALFVVLTAVLYQKGSAESKDPDEEEDVDQDPAQARRDPKAPWPVRRGGWAMRLYSHSLSLTFLTLFLVSITIHAAGGVRAYNAEEAEHHKPPISTIQYVATSRFWFESFQNWQSEFLSLAAMVVLTIFLRQRGSPESKPVAAGHEETGK